MNIWCVGRNYSEHAKELGNEIPKEPLFFLKSHSALTHHSKIIPPKSLKSLHFELELAFKFDADLKPYKIALALDLTDRVRQNEAKKAGTPWTLAKSFINSCPISPWIDFQPQETYYFELWINSELKQNAHSNLMLFNLDQLRSYLVEHFPLQPGDILLSGTPSGVGELHPGDRLQGLLKNNSQQILIEWNTKVE